jgi:hypothetical protein
VYSSSPYEHYETSTYTATTTQYKVHKISTNSGSREPSPSNNVVASATSTSGSSSRSQNYQQQNVHFASNVKIVPNTLGFQLNENELRQKGIYVVKYVESNSPSALAGLKEGDKITKINGKLTAGMSYELFCHEIEIAQKQQQRNNMIHLMVMRKTAKTNGSSSYLTTTTATSSVSNLSGPTVLPIKNNLKQNKTTSFTDEGYVPGSASSSSCTTTAAALGNASSTNIPCDLVSVIRVTSISGKIIVTIYQMYPATTITTTFIATLIYNLAPLMY